MPWPVACNPYPGLIKKVTGASVAGLLVVVAGQGGAQPPGRPGRAAGWWGVAAGVGVLDVVGGFGESCRGA
ncbi:MAG TPA: hypothetical protein VIY28_12005 [Pseudonocardiaceae bacterium]